MIKPPGPYESKEFEALNILRSPKEDLNRKIWDYPRCFL